MPPYEVHASRALISKLEKQIEELLARIEALESELTFIYNIKNVEYELD